jgi:hypothetical protein
MSESCPLSGVKQTWPDRLAMSATDAYKGQKSGGPVDCDLSFRS